ncbi:MAG TPA: type II secretion system minor pseudopilin GspK [Steroidobacteraceae bacterium]|nr:type II secretion system minor pseudopilin GspK [Steroidobacteraceae bacterium]
MSGTLRRARRAPARASRQRGIALLTAILLVALGTILATALAYQNAMTARRGQGSFAFDESVLVAEAGEALAAYALVQSRQGNNQDYPGQPWSTTYGPVEVVPGITLTAQVEDLAGRFNLNQLVDQYGVIDPQALQAFQNLLEILGLESKWGPLIADWIDADSIAWPVDGAEDATYLSQQPPYRTANRQITSASELLALPGFGRDRYLRLAPYVTALPRIDFKINLCSASGPVLDALGPTAERNYSAMDAQALAKERTDGCFPTLAAYQQAYSTAQGFTTSLAKMDVAETSNYFRLLSIVDVGSTRFYLYSLLHREQNHVHVIQRSFTAD